MARLYQNDESRLENTEVRKYFIGKNYPPKLVDKVLEQFWFRDLYISLVTYRPYFELLDKYFKKYGIEAFTRPGFYKFIFEELVGSATGTKYKQVQELALAFEQMHTDRLDISEFSKLVEKLKISPELISELVKSTPLFQVSKVKEEGDREFFIWGHHTLSEYLAADYILNQKVLVETVKKLMIFQEGDFVAFKSSWYGTLRFLLESDKAREFIEWLTDLGEKYPDNIDDDFSQIFLHVDPEKLGVDLKGRVFELIYSHYKEQVLWLPVFARRFIGRFFLKKHFELLEADIKEQETPTKTFVYRGNVVAVIDSLFENKSPILTEKGKDVWKKRFVEFANDDNENGVLQRHSLDALVNYHDPSLIPQVAKTFGHKDSLVREAFIQFCYQTDPNSNLSIDYMVKVITSGMVIYGRFGLYEITTRDGLSYLLDKFISDQNFLKVFIDRESIFDEEKEVGDHTLIKHLVEVLDPNLLNKLETLILNAFKDRDAYHLERSSFIQKIASLIAERDPDFIFKLIKQTAEIPEESRQFTYFLVEHIFPYLLTESNLKGFIEEMSRFPLKRAADEAKYAVYTARRELKERGVALYEFAVKQGLVPKIEDLPPEPVHKRVQKDEYEEFQRLLTPEPGKYSPQVFEFFVRAYDALREQITKEEREKLIGVTKNILSFDTHNIKLSLADRTNNSQFTWTDVASFFGDAVRVAKLLAPEVLGEYRQHLIDFIPFAFSDDQATLTDVLNEVTDEELKFVYGAYSNKGGDLRYFLPSSFIYVVSEFKKNGSPIEGAGEIFLSLALDKIVGSYDRVSALENYSFFIDSADSEAKRVLEEVFKDIVSDDPNEKRLAEIANGILIEVFKDKTSIEWRFDELVRRAFPFYRESMMEVHSVGPHEEELDSMSFAKPLISLKSPEYQARFLGLLECSLEVLSKNDDLYWSYVNYLWRVVTTYFDGLKELGSIKPYLDLQKWVSENLKGDKSNWFLGKLAELRNSYINFVGKESVAL